MIDDVDARVRRRCNETVAAIMAAVDATDLPRRQRQAVRRAVMGAVHGQGDDIRALIAGIADPDGVFTEGWLTSVGFGTTAPDPDMHAALVATSEDGDHGTDQRTPR